jgi:PEP-CTERM motif
MRCIVRSAAVAALTLTILTQATLAATYTVSYPDGGTWNTVYVQGFSTSLGASPNLGLSSGDPVVLSKFEFFKSGNADSASNIKLAILNSIFPGSPTVDAMTSTSPTVVGLSTNTIASTVGIATGDSIAFDFANLPLSYGSNYAAVFVNVGTDVGNGAPLTPVLVSALTANYVDIGGGDYHPVPNYGTDDQYDYATSNSISGGYFQTFGYAGDANFRATFSAVPEPTALLIGLMGTLGAGVCMRRRSR